MELIHTYNSKLGRMFFAIALIASGSVASAATVIPANASLNSYLTTATVSNYEFELAGNATLSSAFALTATRPSISIDAKGSVITRNGAAYFLLPADSKRLIINNATITGTLASGGSGAVAVTTRDVTLEFDNTIFSGNTNASGLGNGGAITLRTGTNTEINGNVSFINNKGLGDASGAVGVYGTEGAKSSVIFTDKTTFKGNTTENYGGALTLNYYSTATFKDDATFSNNSATSYFGGAIDLYGGHSYLTFEKNATFDGNYVKNTFVNAYGARGGSINIGYTAGVVAGDSQIDAQGVSTFENNYVWGYSNTNSYGGAISLASGLTNIDTTNVTPDKTYSANFEQGIFTNNYAYSERGSGYGGAIYVKTYNAKLTLGDGSEFIGNAAKTKGGAIYFDQGTLSLNGNVTFSGNEQGATFDTTGGVLTHNVGSGTANAIYFAVSTNTATLNVDNAAGQSALFYDPIESAAGKSVIVNKTGAGTILFDKYNSDILARTTVSGGTFQLTGGASYGRLGTAATSFFNLSSGAKLSAESGTTLRVSSATMNGIVSVGGSGGNLNFIGDTFIASSAATFDFSILDSNTNTGIDFNGADVSIVGSYLYINASGYMPADGDKFKIMSNLSAGSEVDFAQGNLILINGSEFEILREGNDIWLIYIPEPSTIAAAFGGIALAFAAYKRRNRK